MKRLLELYKKTQGGHVVLPEEEFEEYATLRKLEYQTRRGELEELGCTDIRPHKDAQGDIIGFVWSDPVIPDND